MQFTAFSLFSFGVIMLEVISGRKNTTFYESDRSSNLLGYGYDLGKEGRCLELMDPTLADSDLVDELMECIQVALLCIQESAKDRPTMSGVVSMLSSERTSLPMPKQLAFSTHLNCDGC
ncbi:cysteine-rich receptor-like protein kinase 10 [Cornus florida]|uniref:cysteine-rich receptor-like protein kinase 10 n=1 Tax=Cornus florida TaxID=4283 RepID=UPI0028980DF4|nr:cysteine-rich receptor-like protein kinase 10 [Cornus florida]